MMDIAGSQPRKAEFNENAMCMKTKDKCVEKTFSTRVFLER